MTVIDLEWARIERELRQLNKKLDEIGREQRQMIGVLARYGAPLTEEMRRCLEGK